MASRRELGPPRFAANLGPVIIGSLDSALFHGPNNPLSHVFWSANSQLTLQFWFSARQGSMFPLAGKPCQSTSRAMPPRRPPVLLPSSPCAPTPWLLAPSQLTGGRTDCAWEMSCSIRSETIPKRRTRIPDEAPHALEIRISREASSTTCG